MQQTLLASTTASATSKAFSTQDNPTGLTCYGLTGSETVTVEVLDMPSGTFKPYTVAGVTLQATATSPLLTMWESSYTFRCVKTATVNAVGIGYNAPQNGIITPTFNDQIYSKFYTAEELADASR